MKRAIHICSFSSALGDLPKRQRADDAAVLAVLSEHPRFSCFEASEPPLGRTLERLRKAGRIEFDNSKDSYPWSRAIVLPEPVPCEACGGIGSTLIVGRHRALCGSCEGNGWVRSPRVGTDSTAGGGR